MLLFYARLGLAIPLMKFIIFRNPENSRILSDSLINVLENL